MDQENKDKILYSAKPSKKLIYYWAITKISGIIWIFGIFFIWAAIVFSAFLISLGVNILALSGIFIFLFLGIALLLYLMHHIYFTFLIKTIKYQITEKRIIVEGGIFRKLNRSVYFNKITDVTRSQNFLEQILKIYRLSLQTASSGLRRPEIEMLGLTDIDKPLILIQERLNSQK